MIKNFKSFFAGRQSPGPVDWIVTGLGNPGKEYENTRHNMGFMAVDYMSQELNIPIKRLKFQALCGDGVIAGRRVLFLKPSTYMNNSGQSVRDAMQFYKVPIGNVLLISDDISLDVGKMRIRRSGSDGGQKGLKNIIYLTGEDTFPRIRLGIGAKPHPDMELAAWVLSKFTKEEGKMLDAIWGDVMDAAELIISGKIDQAMNRYN